MINDSVIFFQHMFTQLIDSIQFLIHPTMFINSPTYTCFELNRGQYGHNRKEFPFENQLNPRLEKIASNGIQSFHCQVLHEHLARLNTPSSPDLPRPRDPLGPPAFWTTPPRRPRPRRRRSARPLSRSRRFAGDRRRPRWGNPWEKWESHGENWRYLATWRSKRHKDRVSRKLGI